MILPTSHQLFNRHTAGRCCHTWHCYRTMSVNYSFTNGIHQAATLAKTLLISIGVHQYTASVCTCPHTSMVVGSHRGYIGHLISCRSNVLLTTKNGHVLRFW
ncbi:hypothetical protein TRVL_04338 [Trypanosoma vivax]|uniref:Uncharacterized protein n=1 Tax=Trypanosoma vivax (strain Y486) TaxID=1055687 RepID=G0U4U9_TRYVY|nr:hypothetical protein TRVL_04338 [Trypanosoma vivax]CCC52464.1 hypothetical protein, unlikely [Trypanosoma vivax Y486]